MNKTSDQSKVTSVTDLTAFRSTGERSGYSAANMFFDKVGGVVVDWMGRKAYEEGRFEAYSAQKTRTVGQVAVGVAAFSLSMAAAGGYLLVDTYTDLRHRQHAEADVDLSRLGQNYVPTGTAE